MSCRQWCTRVAAYVDGELGVGRTLAVQAHLDRCPECRRTAVRERRFRVLLRRQPCDATPAELRGRILADVQHRSKQRAVWPWRAVAAGLGAALLAVAAVAAWELRADPVTAELVAAHIAYGQLDGPAEFPSVDGPQVEAWFRQRAHLRVVVPDNSPAGIHLIGGRIAEARAHRIAHLVYEKGHTLLSVFVAPGTESGAAPRGARMLFRGREYVTEQRRGHRTVSWTEGTVTFVLVSLLGYDDLLHCADRLRAEYATRNRL
jgi:mycothiol system anti-sigma-R factor